MGRDFLTLHGECPAGARGVPAWADQAESRPWLWAEDPQLLQPPSAPPRARPSALLSLWGNLCPGFGVGLPGATLRVSRFVPPIRPGGREGYVSEDFPKDYPLVTPASGTPPYPGHGKLGSMVQRTRRSQGGKEPASTNNRVLPAPSGPPGEAPQNSGVPGTRPAAWVWRVGVGVRARRCARLAEVRPCRGNCPAQKS